LELHNKLQVEQAALPMVRMSEEEEAAVDSHAVHLGSAAVVGEERWDNPATDVLLDHSDHRTCRVEDHLRMDAEDEEPHPYSSRAEQALDLPVEQRGTD
jgi:hypothetical protein